MSDVREKLFNAVFGQESSHGKAPTDKPNKHGVLGPMQIMPATWTDAKRLGIIPADWQIDNPEQNKEGGRRWLNHLMDTFGNDPAKAAAAYYSGKGAVKKDGTIANWSDKLYPTAPTTHQYVQQVLARAGLGDGATAATSAAQAQVDVMQREMPGKAPASPVAGSGGILPADPLPTPVPGSTVAAVAGQEAAARAQADRVRDVDFTDRARAAFLDTPTGAMGRVIIDRMVRDELPAEPGYKPDPSTWGTRSEDEIHELLDATSRKDEERRLASQAERRQRQETVMSGGLGPGLLAGLVAGIPEGFITGALAYKGFQLARIGSAQLASQGRTGAALGSALAENAGLNVGLTAVQDAIDGYQGPAEYAFGAAFGLLGTGAAGFGIKADVAAFQAQQMAEAAAQGIARKAEQAAARLGPSATPEQIRAEITRREAEEASAPGRAAEQPLGRERRLLDVDDEGNLRVEAQTASTPEGKAAYRPLADAARPDQQYAVPGAKQFEPTQEPQMVRDHYLGMDDAGNARQIVPEQQLDALFSGDKPGLVTAGLSPAEEAAVRWMFDKYMPDAKVVVAAGNFGAKGDYGDAALVRGGSMIRVHTNRAASPDQRMQTLVHEMGHSIWKHNFSKVSVSTRAEAIQSYNAWLQKYHGKTGDPAQAVALERTSLGQMELMGTRAVRAGLASGQGLDEGSLFEYLSRLLIPKGASRTLPADVKDGVYYGRLEEFTAEQFGKYIESRIEADQIQPPAGLKQYVVDLLKRVFDLFKAAKAQNLLRPTEGFADFFDEVAALHAKAAQRAQKADAGLAPFDTAPRIAVERSLAANDPVAERHGLNILPEGTDAQRAEKRAIIEMYRKAENPEAPWNNIDPRFIASITDNSVFNVASTSLLMLKSQNPVVRMIAAELLESPTGAAGRQATAAIAKHINERKYMGNAVNDFQAAYKLWRNENGGNIAKDALDGEHWQRFNRAVAEYVESRRDGTVVQTEVHPAVMRAAGVIEQGYERMRVAQITNKTLGWAGLPETSAGYMPHRMSPERVRNMTPREGEILHSALVDQFVQIEGWDISFSANLAGKYIDRIRARAVGEYDSTVNVHSPGASEIVEDALNAMGMPPDEVKAQMAKYMRGGAGHTKRRIRLDLNEDHGDGFRLLDLFETDQLRLLRQQAQRVSGEVALARHGVMGKPGLKLLRRAAGYGGENMKADAKELEALDQASAELLGEPFGAHQGKWLDRAVQVNSLARLGGMGFTQLAEFINGIVHVGAARTLSSIGSMRRLRAEIIQLAKGERVDNPIIGSLESYSGAQFGTDSYKLVFPFDNHDMQYQVYGKDTTTAFDRLLRGGSHAQAKLSMWRAIHSSQQRGMAEQIVKKALETVAAGRVTDTALADMGFTPDVIRALQSDLDAAATFDGGRLTSFDITKMRDKAAAEAFIQAVHRGAGQIIQGTFIGETGKWAHDGLLRVMTQFRTFSITSVEKQWGRQLANRGAYQALGILLGSMSLAAPIYMARTYLASVGRSDQDEYLEKHLAPAQVARATLNYVAMSGLSGDMLDALTAVTGVGKVTGGRTGAGTEFVGNVIAPSAGLVDDVWRSLQNTKEGTDPSDFLKTLPFSNLPYMKPLINSLGSD